MIVPVQVRQLRWQDVVRPGEGFHLARVRVDSTYGLSVHTHDFAEVFWVESGHGMHIINRGFNSLGHFYKLFRKRFGVTPHAYRLRHQAVLR